MGEDSWQQQEVQGRLRGLLIMVSLQLPAVTVGIVEEMIDANECGVALEALSETLVESGARISMDTLSDVSTLVEMMKLERINVDRLLPLVQS